MNQAWPTTCFYKVLLGHKHPHSFTSMLSMAAFVLQLQSWVVAIETVWPSTLKIFTLSWVSCIAGRFFTAEPLGKPYIYTAAAAAKSLQSCPTLCDPRDGSPLDSPVPGILQARTLEWVAISFTLKIKKIFFQDSKDICFTFFSFIFNWRIIALQYC